MRLITDWFRGLFHDPQSVVLALILLVLTGIVIFFGQMLAPALGALVIAYLLEGLIQRIERWHMPRLPAVYLVFCAFSVFVLVLVFGLMPLVSRQLAQLVQQLPSMLRAGQDLILALPAKYPSLFSEAQVSQLLNSLRSELLSLSQGAVTWSLSAGLGVITLVVYLILVPFLVFFFLKDKSRLIAWLRRFLPPDYSLAQQVWVEVDQQLGNYVRGKFWEIIIVWSVTYVTFTFMGLQFSLLLGLMVGLSVIVPYVGAAVVTIPVAIVAFFQWGWGPDFIWLMAAYTIIQGLDGNVLVPVLFSEVVNLHPVAIIIAILVFGGIWGFWGVFFAIPLATVVQAVLNAWPESRQKLVYRAPDITVATEHERAPAE